MHKVSKLPLLTVLLCSTLLVSTSSQCQKLAFNASWWNAASLEERTGFILGFGDCPSSLKLVAGVTTADYAKYIDTHITGFSGLRVNAVPDVLKESLHHLVTRPVLKGGEEYPEKHGWIDGEWWGDATHGSSQQKRGYVEGYLSCEFGRANARETSTYIEAINLHFSNPRNEHHKVANVLQPVVDIEKR